MIYVSDQHRARVERMNKRRQNERLFSFIKFALGSVMVFIALDTLNTVFNIIVMSQQ